MDSVGDTLKVRKEGRDGLAWLGQIACVYMFHWVPRYLGR